MILVSNFAVFLVVVSCTSASSLDKAVVKKALNVKKNVRNVIVKFSEQLIAII